MLRLTSYVGTPLPSPPESPKSSKTIETISQLNTHSLMEPFIKYVQVHVKASEDFYSEFLDIGGKGFNDPYDQLVNVYTYKVKNYKKKIMNANGFFGNEYNAVLIIQGFDYTKSVFDNMEIILTRLFEGRYNTLWFYGASNFTAPLYDKYYYLMKYLSDDMLRKKQPTAAYSCAKTKEDKYRVNLPYYDTSVENGEEGEDYQFAIYDVTPWRVESKTKSASKIDKTM